MGLTAVDAAAGQVEVQLEAWHARFPREFQQPLDDFLRKVTGTAILHGSTTICKLQSTGPCDWLVQDQAGCLPQRKG